MAILYTHNHLHTFCYLGKKLYWRTMDSTGNSIIKKIISYLFIASIFITGDGITGVGFTFYWYYFIYIPFVFIGILVYHRINVKIVLALAALILYALLTY